MSMATPESVRPRSSAMSVATLTAMVVGSMVGAGVFSLPARFGGATGVLGSLIAWGLAGVGMLMLALVFQNLAVRRPDLDSGVFIYAKAGFGDYIGFNSAIGYWASAVAGNTVNWVFVGAAFGAVFPFFGEGDTVISVMISSVGVWLFHYLVARGVRSAAAINKIVTALKLLPIITFILVLLFAFDPHVFAQNWVPAGGADTGGLGKQIQNTMLITTFVFIGVEGASVYSRYAAKREHVGRATVLGYLSVLSVFALVTIVSFGVAPREEIAMTAQPSMVGLFQYVVGNWGEVFISAGVIISVLGSYLAWTLMAAEVLFVPAVSGDLPKLFSKQNRVGTPIAALATTTIAIQALLGLIFVAKDAMDFMLDLTSSLVLIPYFLAAAYSLKIAITGRGYEAVPKRIRVREFVIAVLATVYTFFLFGAAGAKYLLLAALILAPASGLYLRARKQAGGRYFRGFEAVLFVLIWVAAVAAVIALATGRIVL